ncbi:MAG: WbuC family cupin fold metalloprotein [Bacteroidales bacterium]|jgi:cupin fold WbuC family metalloprotein|nr:WbuC family cupin fold metalloprotein [Bacteroidales bacterium]
MIAIDKSVLDALVEQAKQSPRKRMNLDLRDSEDDSSQRMLNALEPGTEIPVHRHNETSETVVVIQGLVEEVLFDDAGRETARYHLEPGSNLSAVNVPIGRYHTCVSLRSGSVIMEFKNGKYDPESTEDIL